MVDIWTTGARCNRRPSSVRLYLQPESSTRLNLKVPPRTAAGWIQSHSNILLHVIMRSTCRTAGFAMSVPAGSSSHFGWVNRRRDQLPLSLIQLPERFQLKEIHSPPALQLQYSQAAQRSLKHYFKAILDQGQHSGAVIVLMVLAYPGLSSPPGPPHYSTRLSPRCETPQRP